MAPKKFYLASAPARLTLTVSRARLARWTEAADAAGESVSAWVHLRLQQYGGWRWLSGYLRVQPRLAQATERLALGNRSEEHDGAGAPGWVRLREALGADHHEWCVELGRMAEQVALQAGLSAGADRPETLARLAPVVLDAEASSVTVVVEPDELDDFRDEAGRWSFDDVNEWAAAMADALLDHEAAPYGVRDCILETRDDVAAAAVIEGLMEELDLWDEADELSRPFLGEHLERTARCARLQLVGRGAK